MELKQKSGIEFMIPKGSAVDETHAWAVVGWGTLLHTKDGKTWPLHSCRSWMERPSLNTFYGLVDMAIGDT